MRTRHKLAGGGVIGVVAGEVDPLRVAKLVAHEVEVPLAAQRQRHLPGIQLHAVSQSQNRVYGF